MFKIVTITSALIVSLSVVSNYVFGMLNLTGVGYFVGATGISGALVAWLYAGPALTAYLTSITGGNGIHRAS